MQWRTFVQFLSEPRVSRARHSSHGDQSSGNRQGATQCARAARRRLHRVWHGPLGPASRRSRPGGQDPGADTAGESGGGLVGGRQERTRDSSDDRAHGTRRVLAPETDLPEAVHLAAGRRSSTTSHSCSNNPIVKPHDRAAAVPPGGQFGVRLPRSGGRGSGGCPAFCGRLPSRRSLARSFRSTTTGSFARSLRGSPRAVGCFCRVALRRRARRPGRRTRPPSTRTRSGTRGRGWRC